MGWTRGIALSLASFILVCLLAPRNAVGLEIAVVPHTQSDVVEFLELDDDFDECCDCCGDEEFVSFLEEDDDSEACAADVMNADGSLTPNADGSDPNDAVDGGAEGRMKRAGEGQCQCTCESKLANKPLPPTVGNGGLVMDAAPCQCKRKPPKKPWWKHPGHGTCTKKELQDEKDKQKPCEEKAKEQEKCDKKCGVPKKKKKSCHKAPKRCKCTGKCGKANKDGTAAKDTKCPGAMLPPPPPKPEGPQPLSEKAFQKAHSGPPAEEQGKQKDPYKSKCEEPPKCPKCHSMPKEGGDIDKNGGNGQGGADSKDEQSDDDETKEEEDSEDDPAYNGLNQPGMLTPNEENTKRSPNGFGSLKGLAGLGGQAGH